MTISPWQTEALLIVEINKRGYGDHAQASAVIVPAEDIRRLATSPDTLQTMVADAVERANSRLSQIERVRRFIIADESFNTDNGQMTATLMRRHVVRNIYGERLAACTQRNRRKQIMVESNEAACSRRRMDQRHSHAD